MRRSLLLLILVPCLSLANSSTGVQHAAEQSLNVLCNKTAALVAASAPTHATESFRTQLLQKVLRPLGTVLLPFGVGVLFLCLIYDRSCKDYAEDKKYNTFYQEAQTQTEGLIDKGILTVPADKQKNGFIYDVIKIAISKSKNVLTPELNQETLAVLQKGRPRENADALGIGVGMGVCAVGLSLKNLYELLVTQR